MCTGFNLLKSWVLYCNPLNKPYMISFVLSNIFSRVHQCPFKMDCDQIKQRFNTKFREVRDCNPSSVERFSILYISFETDTVVASKSSLCIYYKWRQGRLCYCFKNLLIISISTVLTSQQLKLMMIVLTSGIHISVTFIY